MVMAAALIPNHRPKVKGQGWNFSASWTLAAVLVFWGVW